MATNFCTCHDSTAVVACAKLCIGQLAWIWIRAKLGLRHIWNVMGNCYNDGPLYHVTSGKYLVEVSETSNMKQHHFTFNFSVSLSLYKTTDLKTLDILTTNAMCNPNALKFYHIHIMSSVIDSLLLARGYLIMLRNVLPNYNSRTSLSNSDWEFTYRIWYMTIPLLYKQLTYTPSILDQYQTISKTSNKRCSIPHSYFRATVLEVQHNIPAVKYLQTLMCIVYVHVFPQVNTNHNLDGPWWFNIRPQF